MVIKWFPRSWLQIKSEGSIIYTDPSFISTYFTKYPKLVVLSDAEDDSLPENLEAADLILISHTHTDHCKEVTINRLCNRNTVIYTPKRFTDAMDDKVEVVRPSSKHYYKNIEIEVVDAYNTETGASTWKAHKKGDCVGYILNIENKRIYFSGDTDFIPEMKTFNNIDLAFLPIGGTFTMNIEEATLAALAIKPQLAVPIHHLKADPKEFKRKLEDAGVEVRLLDIGEELII